ncbi:MAG: hypothetical protein JST19_20540 [Bacteroidetes bacterium]|nr:hypothetical protein [Bacteroidota bacterium]
MKRFKRILRICALVLFMLLAATGITILGVAPPLKRDRKLFADVEMVQAGHTDNDQNGLKQEDEAIKR